MTRSASSVNALSLAISFSFRKFEHTRQNIWLTMKRPYLYHCFSVKRGQVYDYDKNSETVRTSRFRLAAGPLHLFLWTLL
ncbi:hypothetical protein EKO15_00795 [Enterobacter bugandensis]|nr:hypothetical protein EKO15_00795 [Enterobacter bugandensis]